MSSPCGDDAAAREYVRAHGAKLEALFTRLMHHAIAERAPDPVCTIARVLCGPDAARMRADVETLRVENARLAAELGRRSEMQSYAEHINSAEHQALVLLTTLLQ